MQFLSYIRHAPSQNNFGWVSTPNIQSRPAGRTQKEQKMKQE